MKQQTPEFTISNIQPNSSGIYTCHYCYQSTCSKPSDAVQIYIQDTFPHPKITVVPKKIVHPGQEVTITCSAPYPNIIFSFLKNNKLIKEDANGDANGGSQYSYTIKHAKKEDSGQYSCSYKTKPDFKPTIHSLSSNPMMIKIIDLPKPLISWQADSEDNGTLNIYCTAPSGHRRVWFQLFTDGKDIQEAVEVENNNKVTFTVMEPKQTKQKYYCIYRIKMGDTLADSAFSDMVYIGSGHHTTLNIIRLLLAAMILILAGFITFKHFTDFQKIEAHEYELPVRYKLGDDSEETKVECKSEV
ncbi:osteoclast-associated immunoglobulin-like receptor [Discoglossus pictus]